MHKPRCGKAHGRPCGGPTRDTGWAALTASLAPRRPGRTGVRMPIAMRTAGCAFLHTDATKRRKQLALPCCWHQGARSQRPALATELAG